MSAAAAQLHSSTRETLLAAAAAAECNLFDAGCLFLSVGIIWPHSDRIDANATACVCEMVPRRGRCLNLQDINQKYSEKEKETVSRALIAHSLDWVYLK